jgi:hypothetical protein
VKVTVGDAPAAPVPVTLVFWGLLPALSVTVKMALRDPMAAGVKVTLIVQVPLAARVEGLRGQLLVCPKSPGLVPVKPMLVMVNAVPLGFESVTALATLVVLRFWPLNVSELGARLGGAVPVPVSVTVWLVPARLPVLSVTVRTAIRLPVAIGVNVTLKVQIALAASAEGLMGQLLVWTKSPEFVPVMLMLVMIKGSLPAFVSVVVCGALVVPTC